MQLRNPGCFLSRRVLLHMFPKPQEQCAFTLFALFEVAGPSRACCSQPWSREHPLRSHSSWKQAALVIPLDFKYPQKESDERNMEIPKD